MRTWLSSWNRAIHTHIHTLCSGWFQVHWGAEESRTQQCLMCQGLPEMLHLSVSLLKGFEPLPGAEQLRLHCLQLLHMLLSTAAG